MKASVYIATTVDGFIARKNGDVDWLPDPGDGEGTEDYGYQEFIDSVDALVMGRNTYELVLSFDVWPYGNKLVIVLSSGQVDIPEDLARTVEWMCASPRDAIARLKARGFEHIYIDGGNTIQRFLQQGSIQRLIITTVPILIGDGIPLFGSLPGDVRLNHIETRQFANGLVQSEYDVMESRSR